MSEKEMLHSWLISLYASLKETNKEIKELEDRVSNYTKLHEMQLERLKKWLSYESLDFHVKEELEYSKEFIERIPDEDKKKLINLKNSREATLFMIEQVEKELRG